MADAPRIDLPCVCLLTISCMPCSGHVCQNVHTLWPWRHCTSDHPRCARLLCAPRQTRTHTRFTFSKTRRRLASSLVKVLAPHRLVHTREYRIAQNHRTVSSYSTSVQYPYAVFVCLCIMRGRGRGGRRAAKQEATGRSRVVSPFDAA